MSRLQQICTGKRKNSFLYCNLQFYKHMYVHLWTSMQQNISKLKTCVSFSSVEILINIFI